MDETIPNDNPAELAAAEEKVRSLGDTPLCPRCLQPIDPFDHYCKHCGEASGRLTPYIPFVNIHYNYSIFGRLWQKTWQEKETGLIARFFYLFMIVVMVPLMLLGLPFAFLGKRRKEPTDNHHNRQK
jgi:hypothetical protein